MQQCLQLLLHLPQPLPLLRLPRQASHPQGQAEQKGPQFGVVDAVEPAGVLQGFAQAIEARLHRCALRWWHAVGLPVGRHHQGVFDRVQRAFRFLLV